MVVHEGENYTKDGFNLHFPSNDFDPLTLLFKKWEYEQRFLLNAILVVLNFESDIRRTGGFVRERYTSFRARNSQIDPFLPLDILSKNNTQVLYETRLTIYFLMKMKSDSARGTLQHPERKTKTKDLFFSFFWWQYYYNVISLSKVIYDGKCGLLQKKKERRMGTE